MNRPQHIIQKLLLAVIGLVICLPLLQQVTTCIDVEPLKGDIKPVKYTPFTIENWNNGTYAKLVDTFLQSNFGLQPEFIRMDNQIAYSLFGNTRARSVLKGKSDYLYEQNYIDAWTGKDFLGEDTIHQKVRTFKLIQDSLQARGKASLIVLAPGKASFYPEFIPDRFQASDSTNYKLYRKLLAQEQVSHIDFQDWFIKNKHTSPYPLYPKTGTHWSEYGMLLAMDSLLNRLQEMFPNKQLGTVQWDSIAYVDERRFTDRDIEEALNLYIPSPNIKMAYPTNVRLDTMNKDNITLIVISDSFFWRMHMIGIIPKILKGQFWYYNYTSYTQQFTNESKVKYLNLEEEINNADGIIFMSTEGNLDRFPWKSLKGLREVCLGKYKFDAQQTRKDAIDEVIQNIKKDAKWFAYIKQQAHEQQIPLDTALYKNAIFVLDQ